MRRFLIFSLLILVCGFAFSGSINSLKTEHFQIVYPEECSDTANIIYSGCEAVYEKVSSLIGNMGEKIFLPVVIRSDVKPLNAYYTGYPYHSIVLYDTFNSQSGTLDNYNEKMLDIFEHELTHALLFNHKDKFWQVIDSIFCDGFTIQGLYVHPMFSEGLSVYSESRNGSGRLNDNYFLHKVKQAKIEDDFPSWFKALGGVDFGNMSDSAYSYGGPFVGYLARRYGEKKLSEFYSVSSSLVFKTVSGIFREVFGDRIEDVWEDFRNSIELPDKILTSGSFSENGKYADIYAYGDKLYALNTYNSEIEVYDTHSLEKIKGINSYGAVNFSVSDDGKLVLGIVGENTTSVLIILQNGEILRNYNGYYRGFACGKEKLILVRNVGSKNFIDVYSDYDSKSETVELGYGCDVSGFSRYDDEYLSFVINKQGKTNIGLFNVNTNKISVVENPNNIRFKSVKGHVYSWVNSEPSGTMVRFGFLDCDDENFVLKLSDDDYSGGTFSPVLCNDRVFFVGKFAENDRLCYVSVPSDLRNCPVSLFDFEEGTVKVPFIKGNRFSSIPYLFRGTLIPLASYSDEETDLTGLGLTYITKDPYERWTFNASGGYSFDKNTFFANINLSERLAKNFYLKQIGNFKYNNKKETKSYEGEASFVFKGQGCDGASFSVDIFGKPMYYYEKMFLISGLRSSFSSSKSCGNGPFDYVGFDMNVEGNYEFLQIEDFNIKSDFTFHIPHLLKTGFVKNRFTLNLPLTLNVYYERDDELSGTVSVCPFAMEIQGGTKHIGLFFNRLATGIGWQGRYDIEDEKYENIVFASVRLQMTPAIGMGDGNVFGSLGLTIEMKDFDELKAKLNFSLII